MMEQPPPARARMPKMATRAKCPVPLTTQPPTVDMLTDHIIRLLNEKTASICPQPLTSRKPDSYSSALPAGEGIGTPKPGTSIGPVGAIERKARVSARTDSRASCPTWRVRPAFRTLTNMPHFLALTLMRSSIGRCLKRETSRKRNCENRRHHQHHVTHSALLCLCQHRHKRRCTAALRAK